MTPAAALRVARPTDDSEALLRFYRDGLGLEVLALEFTHQRGKTVGRAPTGDHLLVLYLQEWRVWAEAVMAEKGPHLRGPGRLPPGPPERRLARLRRPSAATVCAWRPRPSVATPGGQPGPARVKLSTAAGVEPGGIGSVSLEDISFGTSGSLHPASRSRGTAPPGRLWPPRAVRPPSTGHARAVPPRAGVGFRWGPPRAEPPEG